MTRSAVLASAGTVVGFTYDDITLETPYGTVNLLEAAQSVKAFAHAGDELGGEAAGLTFSLNDYGRAQTVPVTLKFKLVDHQDASTLVEVDQNDVTVTLRRYQDEEGTTPEELTASQLATAIDTRLGVLLGDNNPFASITTANGGTVVTQSLDSHLQQVGEEAVQYALAQHGMVLRETHAHILSPEKVEQRGFD